MSYNRTESVRENRGRVVDITRKDFFREILLFSSNIEGANDVIFINI